MIDHDLERKYPFLQHMREMSEAMYSRQRAAEPISARASCVALSVVVAVVLMLTGCATRPVHVTQMQPGDTTQRPITQPQSPWDFPRDPEAPRDPDGTTVVLDKPQWRVDALAIQRAAIRELMTERIHVPMDLVAVRDCLEYGLAYLREPGATWRDCAGMQASGIAHLTRSGVGDRWVGEFRRVLVALRQQATREG